mmetsp:Transcript_72847/g.160819  ORF Transcript_72847/g.160819 Transcript_72847/m.160819 type:complete len:215 (-) Transcript_72847:392-1036(-)
MAALLRLNFSDCHLEQTGYQSRRLHCPTWRVRRLVRIPTSPASPLSATFAVVAAKGSPELLALPAAPVSLAPSLPTLLAASHALPQATTAPEPARKIRILQQPASIRRSAPMEGAPECHWPERSQTWKTSAASLTSECAQALVLASNRFPRSHVPVAHGIHRYMGCSRSLPRPPRDRQDCTQHFDPSANCQASGTLPPAQLLSSPWSTVSSQTP